jgi:hypothetical protein
MNQYTLNVGQRRRSSRTALLVLVVALIALVAPACYTGGSTATDPSNALSDRDAVSELKARYFRFLDTKYWSRFRGLFLDDAVIDTTVDGGPLFDNADLFVGFLQSTIGTAVTVHHGHMLEFDQTSATTAEGIWALEDLLKFPLGSGVDAHGRGYYRETYEKVGGNWRIASLKLSRLRMDFG